MMLAAPAFAEGEDSPSSRGSIFGDLNTESLFNTAYPSSEEPQQEEVKQELPKSAVYIKNIEITGNRLIDTDTVYRQMELKPGDAFSAEVVQQNLKSIYNMGYFSEKIKAVPVKLDDNNIKLKIIVEENLPVTDFMIEGNESISTGEILKILEPMLEKPQNIHDLNDAIEQIQDLYASQGYILARVTNVTDDPDGTVNLTIDEGTINSIIIQGNKKTKEFVVRRNVLTQPGTVYNENLIKMDLMRLYGTQAFKDVKRTIERSEENPERYDVTIHLEEQRTGTISIGGGLDTATGLFGSAGFTENNFRGMGQRISLNVLAVPV